MLLYRSNSNYFLFQVAERALTNELHHTDDSESSSQLEEQFESEPFGTSTSNAADDDAVVDNVRQWETL